MEEFEIRLEYEDGGKRTVLVEAPDTEEAEAIAVAGEPRGTIPHAYTTLDAPTRRGDPIPHDGEVVVTAYTGRNDTLIERAAKLYIRDAEVVADVTYGKGGFWKKTDTSRFTLHATDLLTGIDFRALPYEDKSIDVVVLDPPYIYNPKATVKASISSVYQVNESQENYATTNAVIGMYEQGMREAFRVLRPGGLLWVKCQDGIESGKPRWTHIALAHIAAEIGFSVRDLFILVQETQPAIRWPHQLHARKNHSYLWILEK